jgi:hypothetical protein
MSRLGYLFSAALVLLAIGVPSARAQQEEQQKQETPDQGETPIPAYHSPLVGPADNTDAEDANPQKLGPDTRSLSGAENLSLGVPPLTHSYWLPHFDAYSTADSNGLSATTETGWTTYTSLLAGLDLHQMSGSSDLVLNYMGGGTISDDGSIGNAVIQELQFSEKLTFRRTALSFMDQVSYLPETSFGYVGLNGLSLPGGGSLGLQNGLAPGQSILTTRGQRITNSSLIELDRTLTPRSSLTLVGGYSVLHYFDNDLINFADSVFQAGYNYQMSRDDTIAVLYRFNAYRYSNFNQSINDNILQLSYGRRVTGRLAFQVGAGPEVALLRTPITSSAGASGGTESTSTSSATQAYWSLSTSLTYQLRRTALALNYFHGLGGGSGVLAGSIADTVSGSVSHQFSRTFNGNFSCGYARNSGLAAATAATTTDQIYGYSFGGVNLARTIGRSLSLFLNYQVQYQDSNSQFCVGPTCGTSVVRHLVSMGFSWRDHPIAF